VDTTTKTLVRGNDDEEFVWSGVFRGGVCEELYSENENKRMSRTSTDVPELAIPYSLPTCMALCAFASFVEAIIFID